MNISLKGIFAVIIYLTIQIWSYPAPSSYSQQSVIEAPSDNTIGTLYSPDQTYFIYVNHFQLQTNCFYIKKPLIQYSDDKRCLKQQILITAFSPTGDLIVIGTYPGNVYVFNVNFNNGEISPNYTYSTTVNPTIDLIQVSKQNKIAIGSNSTLYIFKLPQSGDQLIKQNQLNFPSATFKSFQWHPIYCNYLFIGTYSNVQTQSGFFIYDSIAKSRNTINNKYTLSIVLFNNGEIILQSSLIDSFNTLVDVYSYYNGNLTFMYILNQGKTNFWSMKISKNDIYLATKNKTVGIKIFKINIQSSTFPNYLTSTSTLENYKTSSSGLQHNQNELKIIALKIALDAPGTQLSMTSDGNQLIFYRQDGGSYNQSHYNRYSMCSDGTFLFNQECLLCSSDCQTCHKSAAQCRSCHKDSFLKNQNCIKCSTEIPGCLTCTGSSVCESCNQTSGFTPTPQNYKCKCSNPDEYINTTSLMCTCQDFYYKLSVKTQCLPCNSKGKKCRHCLSQDNCTQCNSDENWEVNTVQGKCVCRKGWKEFNNQCVKCGILGCEVCQQEEVCFQCDQKKAFQPKPKDDNTCTCIDSFYMNPDTLNCESCSVIFGCEICSNSSVCNKCSESKNFIMNTTTKTCKCIQSTFISTPTKSCQKCQFFIVNCLSCLQTSDFQKVCKKCQQPYILSQNLSKCQCPIDKGFYIVDGKCVQKEGSDDLSWVIIVGITTIGLIIVGIVSFGIYKYKKRKQQDLKQKLKDANPYFLHIPDQERVQRGLVSSSLVSN